MKRVSIITLMVIAIATLAALLTACGGTSISAPEMNAAVLSSDGSHISVVWESVEGAEAYNVYRAAAADGEYEEIGTVTSPEMYFVDEDVEKFETYYYKVRSVEGDTESEYSSVVSAYVSENSGNADIVFLEGDNTWNSGDAVCSNSPSFTYQVEYKGNAAKDYSIYYDEANVSIVKNDDGSFTISPRTKGFYWTTVKVGDDYGSIGWNFEGEEDDAITFTWSQSTEPENSRTVKYPDYGISMLTVCYNGEGTEDFTVESSNPEIAEVEQNGKIVTVTNKMPGRCEITITSNGASAVFDWEVRDKPNSNDETADGMDSNDGTAVDMNSNVVALDDMVIPCKEGLADTVRENIEEFSRRELSDDEIQELIDSEADLDEVTETLSTAADVVCYLNLKQYTFGYKYNPCCYYNDINWGRSLSAEFTFTHNGGSCGGTSNLVNHLLKGDYTSQGYVTLSQNESGHIFCYFENDGMYYACDFVNPNTIIKEDVFPDGLQYYIYYATDDLDDLIDWYRHFEDSFSDTSSEFYIISIYAYERDGKNDGFGGFADDDKLTLTGNPISLTVDSEIEDDIKASYIVKGYSLKFAKAPDYNMVSEDNVPED